MGKRIVCIVGATACGKTDFSVSLAQRLDAEIISADSVQVYRGMDVGSAKPMLAERRCVPHHMIDCVPIDTPSFSVSQFFTMASEAIDGVLSRGKLPIVVGGSGLYLASLVDPLGFAVPSDPEIRARLEAAYREDPAGTFARLQTVDVPTAERLHPNDAKRIVRALEVYETAGKPLSSFGNDFRNRAGAQPPPYEALQIGLTMLRERLYERINARVDAMLAAGLVEEARGIYDMRYDRRLPAMQSIGYRQLFAYFDGECTLLEAVESIKRETRRFAKRQNTWFLRDKRIRWIDLDASPAAEALCLAQRWIKEDLGEAE